MTAAPLFITAGVLRDINQDRLTVLTMCNARNQGTTAYPFFLHDADSGWDILIQQTFPVQLLLDVPQFFSACLRGVPDVAEEAQEEFLESNVGGHRITGTWKTWTVCCSGAWRELGRARTCDGPTSYACPPNAPAIRSSKSRTAATSR
jgi:hypothetical protein